jgi:hypothetical protein
MLNSNAQNKNKNDDMPQNITCIGKDINNIAT